MVRCFNFNNISHKIWSQLHGNSWNLSLSFGCPSRELDKGELFVWLKKNEAWSENYSLFTDFEIIKLDSSILWDFVCDNSGFVSSSLVVGLLFSSVHVDGLFLSALHLVHNLSLNLRRQFLLPQNLILFQHVSLPNLGRHDTGIKIPNINSLVFIKWDTLSDLQNLDFNWWNVLSWSPDHPFLTSFVLLFPIIEIFTRL